MNRYPKNEKFVDYKEMNKILRMVRNYYTIIFRKKAEDENFKSYAFIEDLETKFKVSLREGKKKITYTTRKDTTEVTQKITGVTAYKILRQYGEIPLVDAPDDIGSAVPLLYYNKKYNETRQKAYAYDLNSAYSDAMTGPMPDTKRVVGEFRKVRRGEIGFIEYDSRAEECPMPKNDLIMVNVGDYADIIFPEMESPFKRFVDVWYARKNNAANKAEKLKAKGVLNYSVGYLQLKNPYIRATIVSRCNNRIVSLMDENTLYCNTDSIVSRVPRPDLKIGKGLGEWKLEHEGMFAYKKFNYQWDNEIPTYRGVPKAWFKKDWDILKDDVPESHNIFFFNKETVQLERINYEEEDKIQ